MSDAQPSEGELDTAYVSIGMRLETAIIESLGLTPEQAVKIGRSAIMDALYQASQRKESVNA